MRSPARETSSSVRSSVIPAASAACELAWITGPSAIGSENGTPTSTRSAPASSMARSVASDRSRSGWPAVRYGTSARRPLARSAAKRRAIASDEVVANADAIPVRVCGLDDGAGEAIGPRLLESEIHELARVQDVPLLVA